LVSQITNQPTNQLTDSLIVDKLTCRMADFLIGYQIKQTFQQQPAM